MDLNTLIVALAPGRMQEITVDDPAAWRELAERFTKLRREDDDRLYACWISSGYNSRGDQWYLTGTEDASTHEHFKWAAERAAVLLGQPTGPATLFFWLDLLKKESPRYRGGGVSETHLDEDLVNTSETGHIGFLCLASAEYCYKLETAAIANKRAEFVPWSPLELMRSAPSHSGVSPFTEKAIRVIAKRLSEESVPTQPPATSAKPQKKESVAAQLDRLRDECRWTVEELAEQIQIDPTTVSRHLSDRAIPHLRNLGAYERVFSKRLERKVVIEKTPGKRR